MVTRKHLILSSVTHVTVGGCGLLRLTARIGGEPALSLNESHALCVVGACVCVWGKPVCVCVCVCVCVFMVEACMCVCLW